MRVELLRTTFHELDAHFTSSSNSKWSSFLRYPGMETVKKASGNLWLQASGSKYVTHFQSSVAFPSAFGAEPAPALEPAPEDGTSAILQFLLSRLHAHKSTTPATARTIRSSCAATPASTCTESRGKPQHKGTAFYEAPVFSNLALMTGVSYTYNRFSANLMFFVSDFTINRCKAAAPTHSTSLR